VSAEIAIIGAGPAGLATAACLRARGVAFRLLDRTGEPGGAYREIYPRTVLASPARYTALPGLAPSHAGEYITAGRYLEYLRAYADHHRLAVERARFEQHRGVPSCELMRAVSTIP
jgi:cation diffusion facilitator CzcD-associated flavoprotein CzcO